jgi:hypothetical protein
MKPFSGWFLLLLVVAGCEPNPEVSTQGRHQVRRILEDDRFDWVTIETANTRVHFPSGSYAETQKSLLPARAEESRHTVLSRLSVSDHKPLLHLFYVDSREDMQGLTGTPVAGYSYYEDQAIVVVFNDGWRAFERHELTHAVTLGTWTRPAGPAVVEGLATYVDGRCGGYENGRVVRTILDQGLLIPMGTLAGDFRQQNDLIAYLQAASMIEFTVDREGPEAVAILWDQGLPASPALLQISADDFTAEFEIWLTSKYAPVPSASWESIRAGGCGVSALPAG